MKKIWLLLFILTQAISVMIAQSPSKRGGLQNGAGALVSLYNINDEMDPLYGLTLRAKYNLINNWSDFSGSFNSGLSVMYHPESSLDSVSFIAADLPLSIELNIGHLATKDFRNFFGFFAGAGYSFSYLNEEFVNAPILTAGIRTWLFSQSFSIRYIHYLSKEENYTIAHGFSLVLNLGEYLDAVKARNKISDFMKPYPKYPQ